MVGVPVSIFVAELALHAGRTRVVAVTCWLSVAVRLGLAATAGGSSLVVLALLALVQVTSFGDVGALAGGAIAAAEPDRRGASLALYAFAGSVSGFIGPVVVGLALEHFGGLTSKAGWTAAFLVMALGSTVTALTVRRGKGT